MAVLLHFSSLQLPSIFELEQGDEEVPDYLCAGRGKRSLRGRLKVIAGS
jgi:hypothetical protein